MEPAAVLFLPAAAALMAMALQLSATAAAAWAPAPIGLPGCSTTCGNVSVPYPFGFGPSRCYWPGLNLTCDTSSSPPRLLLGDGTLRVTHINLVGNTVRVMRAGSIINTTSDFTSRGWNASFGRGFVEYGYQLSYQNELVVDGCNVMVTLSGVVPGGGNSTQNISGCSSFCTRDDHGHLMYMPRDGGPSYCSGGCCLAPLAVSSVPSEVQAWWLYGNHTVEQTALLRVFVAEQGWVDKEKPEDEFKEAPFLLDFSVTQDLPPTGLDYWNNCSRDVHRKVCKSEHSDCDTTYQGYACYCKDGYDGNPYLDGGCQDTHECMIPTAGWCFYCNKLAGGQSDCRCPRGTHGNPFDFGGCVRSTTGLVIGLSVATGPALLLLVLGIVLGLRKFKQHKMKLLKQKYFKQNRGQLLQQLLSQKADIAERMIIPLDELAKATNNFDKAREIGGGGHGTVYKGILSDLHVVAIKKSKITLQKEIYEFINEVAILSQINHKNVVKLFGCCLETEVPLLVYEFIPNGTLYHHLHIEGEERSLSWSNRLRIATEIATSLAYLHSSVSIRIIHRDIKCSNILLDDTMTSKISDFGASRYIPIDNTGLTTRIQGTFGYLDPECFHIGRLTEKSDVYSFGVILVELLTRKKPTCSRLANEYGGLVPHFLNLLASNNLVQIMDPQVLEEGGTEVQEVIMLAASCINLRGEERPTMRQVELTLEGLQQGSEKKYKKHDRVIEEFENGSRVNYPSRTSEGQTFEEPSRRYSLEREMMMSARYPR